MSAYKTGFDGAEERALQVILRVSQQEEFIEIQCSSYFLDHLIYMPTPAARTASDGKRTAFEKFTTATF